MKMKLCLLSLLLLVAWPMPAEKNAVKEKEVCCITTPARIDMPNYVFFINL
jgi:hypothetical protein